jgi:hypothetical protein
MLKLEEIKNRFYTNLRENLLRNNSNASSELKNSYTPSNIIDKAMWKYGYRYSRFIIKIPFLKSFAQRQYRRIQKKF